jgi:ATP-binding cassette subfamily B protein
MRVLKFIIEIARKYPSLLTVSVVLVLAMALIEAASIVTLAPVIDLLTKQDLGSITKRVVSLMQLIGLPIGLLSMLALFLFFNFVKSIFAILVERMILKTQLSVQRDIMLDTFKSFFNARWEFFSSSKQGVLVNTFVNEINIVGKAFWSMAHYFANLFKIALYFIIPFCISWKVTSISLGCTIFFAFPFLMLGKLSTNLGRANTSTTNQVTGVLQEALSLAKLILGFGNQDKGLARLKEACDAQWKAVLKSWTLIVLISELYLPFGLLVLVITLFTARHFALPFSETSVLIYSLVKAVPQIGLFLKMKSSIDNFFPSYEQIITLKGRAKEFAQPQGGRAFSGFKRSISAQGLDFAYVGHKPVLHGINLLIHKGKMVAVVGESGSGKTTLIDLIMGFHKPSTGGIKVDDINLADFDLNSYRRRIGYVPQDSVLFNLTIADNLRWAKEDASDEEIRYACQMAHADEFIQGFQGGYDTLVGDRGVRLSGGQIQRIALARAILRKPEILILDEATSSLDTHSERLIQEAIENIAKETTVIVIAHRLSTIAKADYIYVLKKGRVIEEGSYAQLIAKNGEFRHMTQLQALGIREKGDTDEPRINLGTG